MKSKLLLILLSVVFFFKSFSQGCSMCRAQIESAEDPGLSVGNGLNTGIYILMAFPYIILFLLFRKQIMKFILGNKNL